IAGLVEGEASAPADLANLAQLRKAVTGVDGIIHLGGISSETAIEPILRANIVGCYNLFEAARLEGVKRIVFASSGHTTGFYERSERVSVEIPTRPDSRYGLSKVFGEGLGSLYADKYDAEVLSIRIGYAVKEPDSVFALSLWISPRDLVQLIRIG